MQYYICSIVIIIEAICVERSPNTQICSMFPIVAHVPGTLSCDWCLQVQLLKYSKLLTAYQFLPKIIWNHENKDKIEMGKPSRRAGGFTGLE